MNGEDVIGVLSIAMVILNIIGIVWLGIKLRHFILVPLGYIIILVIVGCINLKACLVVAIVVAVITFIVILVNIVIAISDAKAYKKRQKEEKIKQEEERIKREKQFKKNNDLLDAVKSGDKETVKKLIEDGADIDCKDSDGATPLLNAVNNKNLDIVSILLENGADVNCKNFDGKTPLDLAKDNEIIAFLKEHGAKTKSELDEAKREQERKEREAEEQQRAARELQDTLNNDLFASIKYHDKEKAESLISQGANVNVSDFRSQGFTPLIMAITNDDIEMVKLLLRHGADARQQVHIIGGGIINALGYARGLGKENIADLLYYS